MTMYIKENGKEIPIEKSITNIKSIGVNNPLNISKSTNNDTEININYNNDYLYNSIKSDTLNISKEYNGVLKIEGNNSSELQAGDGLKIENGTIGIYPTQFVIMKTADTDTIEWSSTENYIKADLKSNIKNTINNLKSATTLEIFEPSSLYSWKVDEYVELANSNLNKNKLTLLKWKNTFFYPQKITSTMVIAVATSYYKSKITILSAILVKGKDGVIFASPQTHSSIDVDSI